MSWKELVCAIRSIKKLRIKKMKLDYLMPFSIKYITIFFLVLLSATSFAQSQERSAFKVSAGISRHIQEKVNAPTLELAFDKDFFPRTFIEINAAWVIPVDVSTAEETRELQSYRFGMNLFFKILEDQKQAFNAGLGFAAGFYATDWTIIATQEEGSESTFTPGFSAIVEYDFTLPSLWFFGGRASISRFDMNRSAWFLGGVLGYRF
jgi:hypothetical protein